MEAARWLLTRLLGALYALAFANAAVQWRGLLGDRGLLPVRAHLRTLDTRQTPTLFAWRYSDDLAIRLAWTGAALSVLLTVGLPQQGPWWVTTVLWLLLWGLYLSLVNVGQIWYAFGWELILLEAGFLAAFLGGDADAVSWPAILMVRWLLFRVEVGAGLIKLRGDPCWRDLTCLRYHHETQPIPGPLSWWAHTRPDWWHRVEVAANHVVQLVLPFGLFLPQPVAGICGTAIIVTQCWLVLTGNFAWLNAVTIVLALSAIPDGWLPGVPTGTAADGPGALTWVAVVAAAVTVVLSVEPVRNLLSPAQRMNTRHNRLGLVGSYGAFGSVTRTRIELTVEGTRAEDPDDPDADWQPYRFRGKPGEPDRRPPQIAPWHLRLDWLMWFAGLGGRIHDRWLLRLVDALLAGTPEVVRLLRHDPFGDRPPRWIRVRRERYRFTTPQVHRSTGDWWTITPLGVLLPPRRRAGVDEE
jgi:hypothetical protein